MITKAQEKRAQRLVLASINDALGEMREYVTRELLAGRTPDTRMMVMITRGLSDLADQYALDLTSGGWGDMIEAAMKAGAADVAKVAGEVVLSVGKAEVEAALFKGYGLIKGILEEGEKVVAEEMLKSIVGGKSERAVAESIAARLQVADEAGDMGAIPRWRAELVARNELSANYRTVKQAAADEAGFTLFRMNGPDDDRISDVCSRYVGQVHTREEWEAIGEKEGINPAYPLLLYGFHPNERHDWDPVAGSQRETE